MKIERPTKLDLVGRGVLTLRPSNYVTTGGEGSVYHLSDIGIKLYTDQKKMVREDIPDKLKLLSGIEHPYVVTPSGLALVAGKPSGFYMPWSDGEALTRVFTNDWRQRSHFGDRESTILVARMRDVVKFAHSKGAILVDPNEFGWLVKGIVDPEPRILDVDSWAIDKWPGTAIMPSIRDWHSGGFNELSDWFAWGVVTFQVYTGIHPYKGRLEGYKMSDLKKRMKDNASVFTDGVRLNHAVRDFSSIPGPLFDWYFATFAQGERSVPPSPLKTGEPNTKYGRTRKVTVTTKGLLHHDRLYSSPGNPPLKVFPCGVLLLSSGTLIDLTTGREISQTKRGSDCEVVDKGNWWLKAEMGSDFKLSSIRKGSLKEKNHELAVKGRRLLRYENRLFVMTQNGLSEILLKDLDEPIATLGKTWRVMPTSTKLFDGVGVQEVFGATFLVLPTASEGCHQVRIKELDGKRPLSAKASERFVSLVVSGNSGQYQRFDLVFNREYTSYSLTRHDVQTPELNMSLLPKGVVALVEEDGELIIFAPTSGVENRVKDKDVSTDHTLANWVNRVVYISGDDLWGLRMSS